MVPRITTKLSVSTAAAVNADLYLLSPKMFNIIFNPAISRYKYCLRLKCLSHGRPYKMIPVKTR